MIRDNTAAATHDPQHALVRVESPNVVYSEDYIESRYEYTVCKVALSPDDGALVARPETANYRFQTQRKVSRLGLLLVGWGGNNGSTLTASVLANKRRLSWRTREGRQSANYIGSFVMSGTIKLGTNETDPGSEVFVPVRGLVPTVHPDDIVIGGWDISSINLAGAVERARVLEPDLQDQLRDELSLMTPMPSLYYPDFIATNQGERADNVIPGDSKSEHLARLRSDIRNFKSLHRLDHIVVLWTASTERYCKVTSGVHDTADNLLAAIEMSHPEVSPSTLFAVAAVSEGCCFVNGSPQNTVVPGVADLAERCGVFVGGDDFKSGQTKVKSVLVDFLVGAGLRPLAISSYNHLGNNDGYNLSQEEQFRSKEISKSSVVDDMVHSNKILYPDPERDAPDHTVVIKYVPSVGDSKRALDEYYTEIFMGGRNTMTIANVCEDSLLAVPLILDLTILCELFMRVRVSLSGQQQGLQHFGAILTPLSYFLKAPVVPPHAPVINSLMRQRACIEAMLRALVGLPVNNEAGLEWKCKNNKL